MTKKLDTKKFSKFLAAAGFVGIGALATAAPFSTSAGGGTVNVPGDYADLKAASVDFNNLAGGIQGNWTLLINTTLLTETAQILWGNATNGNTLTIKPAPGVISTVDLTYNGAAGSGIFGQIVFGTNTNVATASYTTTNCPTTVNGYVLDGNNGTSEGTRHLTIQTPTTDVYGYAVTIWGETNGMIVRNTNIIQRKTSGTTPSPIRFAAGRIQTSIHMIPDNGTIENCYLVSTGGVSSGGVYSTAGATTATSLGFSAKGIKISGNTIVVGQRAIFLNGIVDSTIDSNHVTIVPKGSGFSAAGVFFFDHKATPNNSRVSNNTFLISQTINSGQGASGIIFDPNLTNTLGFSGVNYSGTSSVYNNIISFGTFPTGTTVSNVTYRGIQNAASNMGSDIEHNSIYMPQQLTSLGTPLMAGSTSGIISGISLTSSTLGANATVKNNIVSILQNGPFAAAQGALYVATTNPVVTFAGNNTFVGGTVPLNLGLIGTVPSADLAAWQTAGYDSVASGAQSVNPSAIASPWLTTNLHFITNTLPTGLGAVATSTILTDVDGEVRPATGATPGADEPHVVLPTGATGSWNLYR